MTTLSFYAASGQTICRITTNRCRDVSQHSKEHLLNTCIPSFSQIQEKSKALSWTFFQRNLLRFLKSFFLFCTVNVGEDCPVFDGMYEFCQLSTGGSVGKFKSFSSQPWGGWGGVQIECYQIRYNLYYQGHLQVKKKKIHIMIEFYNIRISKFIAILKKLMNTESLGIFVQG